MNDDKIRNRTYNDCVYNFKNTSYRRFKLKKQNMFPNFEPQVIRVCFFLLPNLGK